MEVTKKRIDWIDTAKFAGIYLMVLGHVTGTCNVLTGLHNFIYSFHMPLFFLLAGITFSSKDSVKKSIAKYSKQLLVPYVFFYLIDYLYWFVLFYLRRPYEYDRSLIVAVVKPLLGMVIGRTTSYSYDVGKSIWFFVSLFSCKVIGRLFCEIKNSRVKFISELCFTLIAIVYTYLNKSLRIILPFYLNETLLSYPFFYVAVLAKKKLLSVSETEKKFFLLLGGIICLGATIGLSVVQGYVGIRGCVLGEVYKGILFYPTAFIGMAMLCLLCMCLPKLNNLFKYMAQNTIIIVGFNRFIITVCIAVIGKLMTANSWYCCLITSILTMFISLIPALIINKYFPFVIGRNRNTTK